MLGWDILAPVYIFWINLVTDTSPAMLLGVEPTEPGIMKQKPRGRKSNSSSGGVGPAVIWQGIFEGLLTLGVYWMLMSYPVHSGEAAS